MSAGAPREPARTLETAEGHAVDYDEDGRVIGRSSLLRSWHTKQMAVDRGRACARPL